MKVAFSTDDVHARDRIDYWHEQAAKAVVAHDFDTHVGHAFKGCYRAAKLGALDLAIVESGPCVVRRTNSYVGRASDDDLLLNLQLTGSIVLHQDGRDAVTRPDDLFLLDPRRPFSLDIGCSMRTLLVKIPRWELQGRLGDVRQLTANPINNSEPMAALASGFLAMLPTRVEALDVGTGQKVAQHLLDLVALALGRKLQDERPAISSPRMTTLLRLKAVIEARLGEPGLRPVHAAEATGISVRYANVLLGHEGMSLERFIMLRRLQRCRRALEDAAQAGRTVSDIAYTFGFSDMSHFTRRFKAQFGISPSGCRQRALTASLSPSPSA
jgi:AraC family transcriptional regulator, positive regulator of tynA and feaB